MEKIRKKLLLTKLSLEVAIALKMTAFRLRFRKSTSENEDIKRKEIVKVIESTDIGYDIEYDDYIESFLDEVDKEMLVKFEEGRKGLSFLFNNKMFLMAVISNRSDIVTHMLEQYFVGGKINEITIRAFLDSPHIIFTEEEKILLSGLVDTDSKKEVLI